jgi:hypothetical protein
MSRGPGKIERAIAAAFEAAPYRSFTIRELERLAYPGSPHTFSHYVIVARVAKQVAERAGWVAISDWIHGGLAYVRAAAWPPLSLAYAVRGRR